VFGAGDARDNAARLARAFAAARGAGGEGRP